MADIKTRFSEAEKRVRDLVTDNKRLRGRVLELEGELAGLQRDMQEFRKYQDQRGLIRERLERILAQVETLKNEDPQEDAQAASQE